MFMINNIDLLHIKGSFVLQCNSWWWRTNNILHLLWVNYELHCVTKVSDGVLQSDALWSGSNLGVYEEQHRVAWRQRCAFGATVLSCLLLSINPTPSPGIGKTGYQGQYLELSHLIIIYIFDWSCRKRWLTDQVTVGTKIGLLQTHYTLVQT